MATPSSILTEAHFAQMENALASAKDIQREIDLAKQAGINVDAAQATLNDSLTKIRQIKSVYFPGR